MGVFTLSDWNKIGYEDLKNQFIAQKPKDVDGVFNASALYYRERLLRRLASIFELENIPDSWDMNYFWYILFSWGYIGVTDTTMGILPLQCSFTGLNVFKRPTKMIFSNPVLGNFDRIIDETGVLIALQYNFHSAQALLQRYSTMLAMCDSSLAVNLMNSKVSFIGMANSKAQAATMKQMFDKISAGEPFVVVNTEIGNPANFWFNRVKENFVGEELLSVKRSIVNDFLTEIGINNANTDKRERLISDEVNANNEEIGINIDDWYENLKTGIEKVNAMFNLNITCKRKKWGNINESSESDRRIERII